ncbi:tryptophan synthase subunit alpha [soil metagenome]
MIQAPPAAGSGTDHTAGAVRIRSAFANAGASGRAALLPYVLAGYPDAHGGRAAAIAAIDAGADLLEIGLPYSDPLADGSTLQRAAVRALAAGSRLHGSMELIAALHAARPATPLVAMGYVNQISGGADGTRGVLSALAQAGASGLIVADLTPDEGAPYEIVASEFGLALVYLVSPTTPASRRAAIAARSGGFLYAVSLLGVTGARVELASGVGRFVRAARAESPVPVAVGFGVSRPEHVRRLAADADGVVVASALIDALGPDGRDVPAMAKLLARLGAATARSTSREAEARG